MALFDECDDVDDVVLLSACDEAQQQLYHGGHGCGDSGRRPGPPQVGGKRDAPWHQDMPPGCVLQRRAGSAVCQSPRMLERACACGAHSPHPAADAAAPHTGSARFTAEVVHLPAGASTHGRRKRRERMHTLAYANPFASAL